MLTDNDLNDLFKQTRAAVQGGIQLNQNLFESEPNSLQYQRQALLLQSQTSLALLGIYEELVAARHDRRGGQVDL